MLSSYNRQRWRTPKNKFSQYKMVTRLEENCKSKMNIKARPWELPWESSGYDSTLQWGGCRFDPRLDPTCCLAEKQSTQKTRPWFPINWYFLGLFQWVSSLHQVAKVLVFQSFGISPSNEYSGLISFRTDWLDLLAVQGTLKSLLQHHSSKA